MANNCLIGCVASRNSKVSVPLRGKYRGECQNIVRKLKQSLVFPSPCGVNIVANPKGFRAYCNRMKIKVSVPLRGKYRGEYKRGRKVENDLVKGFRPLAG